MFGASVWLGQLPTSVWFYQCVFQTWEEEDGDDSDGPKVHGHLQCITFIESDYYYNFVITYIIDIMLYALCFYHYYHHQRYYDYDYLYACLDINCGPNEKSKALSDKARHDRHQEKHEESEEVDHDHD